MDINKHMMHLMINNNNNMKIPKLYINFLKYNDINNMNIDIILITNDTFIICPYVKYVNNMSNPI